jgi:hypothetical protein
MLSSVQLEDNVCSLVKCWRLKLLYRMSAAPSCCRIFSPMSVSPPLMLLLLILLRCRPWIESLDGIEVRLPPPPPPSTPSHKRDVLAQVLAEELVASRNFHDPQHPQYVDFMTCFSRRWCSIGSL